MKPRLFVAIEVPADVRAAVDQALHPIRPLHPELRWTDPSSWHLTLAFVGWVEEERTADVSAATAEAAAAGSPFTMALDGRLGTFGGRVLWAGVEPSEEAGEVARRLRAGLAARGYEIEDREFTPHLTVARAPKGGRVRRGTTDDWRGPSLSWGVDRLVVMRSRLSRSGARYEEWSAALLGG